MNVVVGRSTEGDGVRALVLKDPFSAPFLIPLAVSSTTLPLTNAEAKAPPADGPAREAARNVRCARLERGAAARSEDPPLALSACVWAGTSALAFAAVAGAGKQTA